MPSFSTSPFAAIPQKLIPGQPAYVFGSWASDVAPTRGVITKVALATNVATVTVLINKGNIPIVGALITIRAVSNNSGAFNVTGATLTGVTIAGDGTGTMTFALTHADVVEAAAAGEFLVPQPEVAEALVNGASVAVGLPYTEPAADSGMGGGVVTAVVSFPSIPTTATVKLQGAVKNIDAEYVDLATTGTVAGGSVTATVTTFTGKFNFYRLNCSSVAGGTNPTIIGKILI